MYHIEMKALQAMPLFRDVDPAKLKLLALTGSRMSFEVGQPIVKQGLAADAVHFLLEGEAEVRRESDEAMVRIATMREGSVIGEMGVFLDQAYSATVVPLTPVVTLMVDKHAFMELIRQVPQFSLAVIKELCRRVIANSERISQVVSNHH